MCLTIKRRIAVNSVIKCSFCIITS